MLPSTQDAPYVRAKAAGLSAKHASSVLNFQGSLSFSGQLCHSSKHKSAFQVPNLEKQTVIMVGCETSAHDILTVRAMAVRMTKLMSANDEKHLGGRTGDNGNIITGIRL